MFLSQRAKAKDAGVKAATAQHPGGHPELRPWIHSDSYPAAVPDGTALVRR